MTPTTAPHRTAKEAAMTPEIVVHHPIPDDLMMLVLGCGYRVADVQEDRTTFRLSLGASTSDRHQMTSNVLAVSPRRAAVLLDIGHDLVYELVYAGRLRSVKVGRRRLIPVAELNRFLSEEAS